MSIAPAPPAQTPVSPFRLLLWLKFRLIWRAYRRDKMRIVGTIIMVLLFAPMSLGLAYAGWTMATHSPHLAPLILNAAFGGAYLLWVVTPLLGFSLNESYDPTRLFVYPVSYRTIFAANVVGSLFEVSTLLLLPILIAMIVVIATSPLATVFGVAIVALFLLHTVAAAQAIVLALIGFLRSRRFRDITIVLFPVIALGWYVFQQVAIHRMSGHGFNPESMLRSPLWEIVRYLPPGWAETGMTAAQDGNFAVAAIAVFLLVGVTALTVLLAALTLKQLYLGDPGPALAPGIPAAVPEALAILPATVPGIALLESLPLADVVPRTAIMAMALKEWRYFIREPQYKALAVHGLYTLVAPLWVWWSFYHGHLMHSFTSDGVDIFGTVRELILSFVLTGGLLLATLPLTFNIFGGEGAAITLLFSLPTPRRLILLGKNLAQGAVIATLCGVGVAAGCTLTHSLDRLPLAFAWMAMSVPVVLAAGNLVSIRLPNKLAVRGQGLSRGGQMSIGASSSPAAGCSYTFVYLLCYAATFVALLPAAGAIAVPALGGISPLWYFVSIPLGLTYAAGLYFVSLTLATQWMETRESDIIARIVPTD